MDARELLRETENVFEMTEQNIADFTGRVREWGVYPGSIQYSDYSVNHYAAVESGAPLVPEPSSVIIVAGALAGLAIKRFRKR
jgi:hypothetical protein